MSDITLQSAETLLATSEKAEYNATLTAVIAAIDNASKCGQSSVIFSTKLTDEHIKYIKERKCEVTNICPSNLNTPQYLISWKPEEQESEG